MKIVPIKEIEMKHVGYIFKLVMKTYILKCEPWLSVLGGRKVECSSLGEN